MIFLTGAYKSRLSQKKEPVNQNSGNINGYKEGPTLLNDWLGKDPDTIEIQSLRLNFQTYFIHLCIKIQSLRLDF